MFELCKDLKLNQKLQKNKATRAQMVVAQLYCNYMACSCNAWPTALPGWLCVRPNDHSRARLASARIAARSGRRSARGFHTTWARCWRSLHYRKRHSFISFFIFVGADVDISNYVRRFLNQRL
jgi:hypothetical protein